MSHVATTKACLAITTMAVALGGSGCGATHNHGEEVKAPVTSARTRVVYVRPTTKSGLLKPGYIISQRLDGGVCSEGSWVVSGVAYECGVDEGAYLARSCWPIGKATKTGEVFAEVFCAGMGMLWTHSGVEIRLQKAQKVSPLPMKPAEQRLAWGVELTSGQRCIHLRGMADVFRGETVWFVCTGSDIGLLGEPDRTRPVWTIREVVFHPKKDASASPSAGPLARITVAWYGEGAAT